MKVLLDTHAFLWAIGDVSRLSAAARQILTDEGNELLLSAASLWEIGLKIRAGKLKLPETGEYFTRHLSALGARALAVEVSHVLGVFALPDHHRDPFDRLLVAQCLAEGATLLSIDSTLKKYSIEVVW